MTDVFSVNDNKKASNITSDVGKSPLEKSIALSDQGNIHPASQPKPVEPVVSTDSPPLEPKKPNLQPLSSPLPSPSPDLPPGVEKTKIDTADTKQPSTPIPSISPDSPADAGAISSQVQPPRDDLETSTGPYMDSSNVLHERPDDFPKEDQTTSGDPAVLDALSSFEEEKKEGEPKNQESPADMGEPTKAPDTDEFLKSILNDQKDIAEKDTTGIPKENPKEVPQASEAPYKPAPSFKEQEESLPTPPSSLSERAPIDGQGGQEQSKPAVGVGIDSISGAEPEVAEADDMLKANKPKPKSNPLKIILAVFLAVGVVVAGYLVYKALFPSESSSPETYDLTEDTSFGTGSEIAENYVTDDEQRKADLDTIKEALLDYYAGEGQFPVSESLVLLVSGNVLESKLVPNHLSLLPEDPSTSKSYGYKSNGATFTLTAILDDTTDPEASVEGGKAIYNLIYDPSSASPSSSSTKNTVSATVQPESTATEDINSILNY
jgi:hypothetical protein